MTATKPRFDIHDARTCIAGLAYLVNVIAQDEHEKTILANLATAAALDCGWDKLSPDTREAYFVRLPSLQLDGKAVFTPEDPLNAGNGAEMTFRSALHPQALIGPLLAIVSIGSGAEDWHAEAAAGGPFTAISVPAIAEIVERIDFATPN